MSSAIRRVLITAVLTVSGALPATAAAAAPANDLRAAATPLTLPATAAGTTTGSTLEPLEAEPACGRITGSVWYAFTAPRDGALVVRLDAAGDQDATVDVIRRVRSQLTPLDCGRTNDNGEAAYTVPVGSGSTYLVRVGVRQGSVPGPFSLKLGLASAAPAFPGRPLPRGGARGTLDPLADPAAAFTTRLQAGVSYVISTGISTPGCSSIALFAPDLTTSFDDETVVRDCDWAFFTPDETGRYPVLIRANPGGTATQRYHLRVRAVRPTEIAPGRTLPNFTAVRGSVSAVGGTPFALYRFDVLERARLDIGLNAKETVGAAVLTPGGRSLLRDDGEPVTVGRGRYYVLVLSEGHRETYTLTRSVRTITTTRLQLSRRLPFGSLARLAVRIAPRVSGPVELTVERFEPAFGWQFDRRLRTQARRGQAAVQFRPFRNGLWRVSARYLGTRTTAPSDAGTRSFLVAKALVP